MILHLKRFEFDFDTMRKLKLNDNCQFPISLNMKPYTAVGLATVEHESIDQAADDQEIQRRKEIKEAIEGNDDIICLIE